MRTSYFVFICNLIRFWSWNGGWSNLNSSLFAWMETIGSNFRDPLSTVFTRLWHVSEYDIRFYVWIKGYDRCDFRIHWQILSFVCMETPICLQSTVIESAKKDTRWGSLVVPWGNCKRKWCRIQQLKLRKKWNLLSTTFLYYKENSVRILSGQCMSEVTNQSMKRRNIFCRQTPHW